MKEEKMLAGPACDSTCPHRQAKPFSCVHPQVGFVRLPPTMSMYRPGWCPLEPGGEKDELEQLGTCAACGERYDREVVKWRSVCRLCAHFLGSDAATYAQARVPKPLKDNEFVAEVHGARRYFTIGVEPTELAWRRHPGSYGFSGARFEITFLKSGKVRVSHNVWDAGDVHPGLFWAFPVTATVKVGRGW